MADNFELHFKNLHMKTKTILLLVICAIITLSFTVVSVKNHQKTTEVANTSNEPVGGFVAEEKL